MSAYYNEIDPYCAEWLRNLIAAGHIAPGDVDERSIEDVRPDDVRGYTQCHFFAGIGVWSYALRLARWPDDRSVWTGSCPCQPFSQAGKGAGFADERHLWPAWFHLIRECRPPVVFGEQVAAGIRHGWIDLVRADLENEDYACGHSVFGAHSVGAPHIRQRMFFVADAERAGVRSEHRSDAGAPSAMRGEAREQRIRPDACAVGATRELGHTDDTRLEGLELSSERAGELAAGSSGAASGMADDTSDGRRQGRSVAGGGDPRIDAHARTGPLHDGATFWSDAEWIVCRDGKARPVKPGVFPLVNGYPGRVGILRAAGNAIVPQVAAKFIRAYIT